VTIAFISYLVPTYHYVLYKTGQNLKGVFAELKDGAVRGGGGEGGGGGGGRGLGMRLCNFKLNTKPLYHHCTYCNQPSMWGWRWGMGTL